MHGLELQGLLGMGARLAALRLELTPETLATLLGALLAVLFDWFPGLAAWFDGLGALRKRQVMAGMLALLGLGLFAGSCQGLFESGFSCAPHSLPRLLQVILLAAGVNQAAHLLVKP